MEAYNRRGRDMCRVSYPVYSANAVANCILRIGRGVGVSIDNVKLQKLMYFAQGWALVTLEHPLFDEEIQAWTYGPVVPELYMEARGYGNGSITGVFMTMQEIPRDSEEWDTIDEMMGVFGKCSTMDLVTLSTEPKSPWAAAWKKGKYTPLDLWQMVLYFSEILFPKQAQRT